MNHSFNIDIARLVGVHPAIVFENIQHWISVNKAKGTNFRDGRTWTYNSVRTYGEIFFYLSTHQIRSALQKLIDAKLLVAENYNQHKGDRTLWYALADESILENFKKEAETEEEVKTSDTPHLSKTTNEENQALPTYPRRQNPICQKTQMHLPETTNAFVVKPKSKKNNYNPGKNQMKYLNKPGKPGMKISPKMFSLAGKLLAKHPLPHTPRLTELTAKSLKGILAKHLASGHWKKTALSALHEAYRVTDAAVADGLTGTPEKYVHGVMSNLLAEKEKPTQQDLNAERKRFWSGELEKWERDFAPHLPEKGKSTTAHLKAKVAQVE